MWISAVRHRTVRSWTDSAKASNDESGAHLALLRLAPQIGRRHSRGERMIRDISHESSSPVEEEDGEVGKW